MKEYATLVNGEYSITLPRRTVIDMSTYFIDNGIPAEFVAHGSGENRTVKFKQDTRSANVVLAWIRRWKEGHNYCPFCGGLPETYDIEINGNVHTAIRCEKCGCSTKPKPHWYEDEEIWKSWDKRRD